MYEDSSPEVEMLESVAIYPEQTSDGRWSATVIYKEKNGVLTNTSLLTVCRDSHLSFNGEPLEFTETTFRTRGDAEQFIKLFYSFGSFPSTVLIMWDVLMRERSEMHSILVDALSEVRGGRPSQESDEAMKAHQQLVQDTKRVFQGVRADANRIRSLSEGLSSPIKDAALRIIAAAEEFL